MRGKGRVYSRLLLRICVLLSLGIAPCAALAAELAGHAAAPVHLPYPIAYASALTEIDGQLLERRAADAFRTMQRAARQEGVRIVLRSGYRSHSRQSWLFFGIAAARGITLAERAKVSAPPGFSEHHTGYALDLDDGDDPRPLRQSFDQTRAGKWLVANAHRFCFEMSFPRDNLQGITYEPWHWRFVGSDHAERTFALAHGRYPSLAAEILRQTAGGDDRNRPCAGLPDGKAQTGTASAENPRCTNDPSCPARLEQVAEAPWIAGSAQR